jgi:hypothetical protein
MDLLLQVYLKLEGFDLFFIMYVISLPFFKLNYEKTSSLNPVNNLSESLFELCRCSQKQNHLKLFNDDNNYYH